MRWEIRLRQAERILAEYRPPIPFADFLQEYFRRHKEMGSRDRKELRELCFRFFRIGRSLDFLEIHEQMAVSWFVLGSPAERTAVSEFIPAHIRSAIPIESSPTEAFYRVSDIYPEFRPQNIFPAFEALNPDFKNEKFLEALLFQPLTWIRIRPGREQNVMQSLQEAGLEPAVDNGFCLGFPPDIKLTDLPAFRDGHFVVQDCSSQRTATSFKPHPGEIWWDACAGSGGKGLALLDLAEGLTLYASDVRPAILDNLRQRHRKAGTAHLHTFVADLQEDNLLLPLPPLDGILADVPCTGSGTWARTPENLRYFDTDSINRYAERQYRILKNAWRYLKKGKPLVYITCSVYKAENEDVISRFLADHAAEPAELKYIPGYEAGAENMFLCRLIKHE